MFNLGTTPPTQKSAHPSGPSGASGQRSAGGAGLASGWDVGLRRTFFARWPLNKLLGGADICLFAIHEYGGFPWTDLGMAIGSLLLVAREERTGHHPFVRVLNIWTHSFWFCIGECTGTVYQLHLGTFPKASNKCGCTRKEAKHRLAALLLGQTNSIKDAYVIHSSGARRQVKLVFPSCKHL